MSESIEYFNTHLRSAFYIYRPSFRAEKTSVKDWDSKR